MCDVLVMLSGAAVYTTYEPPNHRLVISAAEVATSAAATVSATAREVQMMMTVITIEPARTSLTTTS